jgi:isoleucyl-tRNA synthetase
LQLAVQGQYVALAPEDIEVGSVAREGMVMAEEGGIIVALNTAISEELRVEGLAREIVRRIQTMRKDADFRIEDSITTYYRASEDLTKVLEAWGDYVQQETLSADLLHSAPPREAHVQSHDLDGESLTLGIVRSPS